MRILVLAHRVPYPPNKGEKIRTYHQIEFLRRCGHQVTVYAVGSQDDYADALALASALNIEVCVDGVLLRWLRLLAGLITKRTLSVCNFRSSGLQRRFDEQLQHEGTDAILCTGSAMASYVFGNRMLREPMAGQPLLIMDFMDLDSDKWDQYRRHSRFPMSLLYRREAWLLERYEKRINARFSSCLFVSQNEVDLFLDKGLAEPGRVSVVGNGVDMEAFRPAASTEVSTGSSPGSSSGLSAGPPDEVSSSSRAGSPCTALKRTASAAVRMPDMVFTGVMDYRPNEDAVCWFVEDTWRLLRQIWPEARFTIAGMSPSERVQRLGRVPGVEVTGKVDSVLPYFHRANLFVAPFRLARGLQNKVLQAFASGVPVITSASGAEGIDCEDGRHLLIAETSADYVAAIARLMSEPDLYHCLRENALMLVRQTYSWDAQNQGLLDILRPARIMSEEGDVRGWNDPAPGVHTVAPARRLRGSAP